MSDRSGLIESIIGNGREYRVLHNVRIPVVTSETMEKNRSLCMTNKCHCYNSSWTCPPNCGSPEYCMGRIQECRDADIYIRTFRNVDFSDDAAVTAMMDGFRHECREIMTECRKRGYDVFALADGPCKYCERCTVYDGKECPYPEMQVPSVSGYGIDMGAYIPSIGEQFSFSKDSVTLYGVFLYKE